MAPRAASAVVVGGGIAGLASAAGLLRGGWSVTVLEQGTTLPLGAGIALAPNGVRALRWLGLADALRAFDVAQGDSILRTDTGRELMRTTMGDMERLFGAPSYGLNRWQLHRILLDAAAEARLHTHCRVTGVASGGGRARVTFEGPNGDDEIEADLVVVADGVHSKTRRALFPEHPGPTYVGYWAWRGLVVTPDAYRIIFPAAFVETWGRDRRFGIARLSDAGLAWYATELGPEGVRYTEGLGALADSYRGWPDPIPQVLALTLSQTLLCHDVYYLAQPLPTLVRDQIALVGDAAAAITPDLGQGGCQALEDAVTLVAAIGPGHTRPDLTRLQRGLAAYDAQRRPRRRRVGRMSARVSRVVRMSNPVGMAVRNTAVALTPAALSLRSSASVFAWAPPARPNSD